jgi:hypothetical protein
MVKWVRLLIFMVFCAQALIGCQTPVESSEQPFQAMGEDIAWFFSNE